MVSCLTKGLGDPSPRRPEMTVSYIPRDADETLSRPWLARFLGARWAQYIMEDDSNADGDSCVRVLGMYVLGYTLFRWYVTDFAFP